MLDVLGIKCLFSLFSLYLTLLRELIQSFAGACDNITGLVRRVIDFCVKMVAVFCDVLKASTDVGEHLLLLLLSLLGKDEVHVQDFILAVFEQVGLLGELAVSVLMQAATR